MTTYSEQHVPVDMQRIAMVADNDHDKIKVFSIFFHVADELLVSMENAMRADAYRQWKDAAHSLKGAAANLGMERLVQKCQRAGQSDRSGLAKRRWMLEDIRQEVQLVRHYVLLLYPELPAT